MNTNGDYERQVNTDAAAYSNRGTVCRIGTLDDSGHIAAKRHTLMAKNRMHTRLLGAVLGTVGLAMAGLALAGTAVADDAGYLNTLHNAGINTHRGDAELMEWGWEYCALLAEGITPDKAIAQAMFNSAAKPPYDLTFDQAHDVQTSAVSDLCPDYRSPPLSASE